MAKSEKENEPADAQTRRTTRAYTLRLRRHAGTCDTCGRNECRCWRDLLWATHEAVNRGAKAFGDWLLTLRGGLSHELADPPPPDGATRDDAATTTLRKHRRILLALSWLSVEDVRAAPNGSARITVDQDTDPVRLDKLWAALRAVLEKRGVSQPDIESWREDCTPSLAARIRDDAVWVNRSAMFDAACAAIGPSLTRKEIWNLLEPFLGSPDAYFAPVELSDDDPGAEDKAKDLVQKAGQWLSSRFGTGKGADFSAFAKTYGKMCEWAKSAKPFSSGKLALQSLCNALADLGPKTNDAAGILGLVSGPGYKSATRNIIKKWGERVGAVTKEDLAKFAEVADEDRRKSEANTGGKGRRPWSDAILADVEKASGFTYLQPRGPAHHSEFAVMLDHAARRVSIAHTWIKRAEAERRGFEEAMRQLDNVPRDARTWLDAFVRDRSSATGGEYRVRRRAIEGWEEVLKQWRRTDCSSEADRVAAAREVQADPQIDKFGDIQLFEALAADDALCVWKQNGNVTPEPLRDYVLGHDAEYKQRRFKVPAYRHPDALTHPVFCDFGNSRWNIAYAIHDAAKEPAKKHKPKDAEAAWLNERHGLRMGLLHDRRVHKVTLRWSSKRLTRDLALRRDLPQAQSPRKVTRADRLGRAAAGVAAGESALPKTLFELDDWNGRLQAPRPQLDAIAERVASHGWDATAIRMRDRLKWLVTFSAKLECNGPFIEYASHFDDAAVAKPFVSTKGELAVKHATNDKRQGHAKLILSRLPGLRVLSVDLGHRFAAACAVWQTLSRDELQAEIAGRLVVAGGTGPEHLFLHTSHKDAGKQRKTIYRRIGADLLPSGSNHPAPWARLDRQFLIKLQGEDAPPRKCSSAERSFVEALERDLGRMRSPDDPLPTAVDELMVMALRSAKLALRRLGDMARIAYAFKPDAVRHLPGGGTASHTADTRIAAMLDALLRWGELTQADQWSDDWAEQAWHEHIGCDIERPSAEASRAVRKELRAKTESRLTPVAERLANGDTAPLHELWVNRWKAMDDGWRPRLKALRRWLLPRGLRPRKDDTEQQAQARAAARSAARHVGGLSLRRIASIRELYQLQKAYAMRPEPNDPRRNVPGKDDERYDQFGCRALDAMERLREQRVKQLASRIVEAALGVGRHQTTGLQPRQRPTARVDPPCHAVVIEDLRNYRPDELQTRRENRALMNWSAGKVRKYLAEGCQLHGLHLREVPPDYTSRQCSRTGLPGVRCVDVAVDEKTRQPRAFWWTSALAAARRKVDAGKGDVEDRFLVELAAQLQSGIDTAPPCPKTVRLPRRGGDLFVAATTNGGTAIQADLNAAANIGLRALLDPDFPGRWWFVPCDSATGKPAKDKCDGAAPIQLDVELIPPQQTSGEKKTKTKLREKTNAWRDLSAADLSSHGWRVHAAYWNDVVRRVVEALRRTS